MKIDPVNKKAREILEAEQVEEADHDVYANAIPTGCTVVLNPGWETTCWVPDSSSRPSYCLYGFQSDLVACTSNRAATGKCWWPNQVPDFQGNTAKKRDWLDGCKSGTLWKDWMNLCVIDPSTLNEVP